MGHGSAVQIQMMETLATGISHEFSNLTTILLASLDLLRRQALDEAGRAHLERAEWCATESNRLARQMLALLRSRATQPRLADLKEVVGTFDKMIRQAAGYEGGLDVRLDLGSEPLPVRLDPALLELTLLHLVRNAAAAMEGTGTLVVRTTGCLADGSGEQCTVEVSVSDTAGGMPPDVVRRATGPGFAAHKPETGAGLGLWIAQRFVATAGGRLVIETDAGLGTTVRVMLPRADSI